MARVLGRLRISRDTEASTAMERQREAIERWAQMMGHEVIGWAEDRDVSRSVSPFKTPGLGPWLNDRTGEWDILVSWKLDRLGSGLKDMVELFAFCEDRKKALVCIQDGVDISTSIGKFIAGVLALIAEMERENVRTRMQNQRQAARRAGSYTGGPYPYGYRPVKRADDKGWELGIDPDAVRIVWEIFDLVTKQSVRSICRVLNERGVPAPKGGKWIPSTITQMVRSRAVLGYAEHNGNLVLGDDGTPVRRDPLVSEETQRKAVEALGQGRAPTNRKFGTALLSGIIICQKCDYPMHVYRQDVKGGKCDHAKEGAECPADSKCKDRRKVHTYSYYRCGSKTGNNTKRTCNASSIRMELADASAEENILAEIGDVERTDRVRISGGDEEKISDLSIRIADLTRRLSESDDDDDELQAEISRLKKERKAERSLGDRWEFRGMGETYAEAWDRMDKTERRAMLAEAGITLAAELIGKNGLKVAVVADEKILAEKFPGFVPFADRPTEDYRQYETRDVKSA